jgi:peptidoglycan/LPS O-acetylase OafA/YrhL
VNVTAHRFETLDAIRGAAAIIVLVHHLELRAGQWTPLFSHGYLAVDLFFALSGFVIAYAYDERLLGGMNLSGFFIARLIRLYPIILLGIVLSLTAAAWRSQLSDNWQVAFLLQLVFIPQLWRAGEIYSFNGAQWSLLFEILINILYAWTLRGLTDRILIRIIALSAFGLFVDAAIWGNLGVGWSTENFLGAVPRTTFGFYVGVFLWRQWSRGTLPKIPLPWWLVVAATIGAMMAASSPFVWHFRFSDPFVVVLLFPALIWLGACSPLDGRWARLGVIAGALSYPIYGLQQPIRSGLTYLLGDPAVQSAAVAPALFVFVLVGSWLALKFYDEPVRRLLGQAAKLRTRGRVPAR